MASRSEFICCAVLVLLACPARVLADKLQITSAPPGATVELDGVAVGTTPFEKDFPGGYFHKTRTSMGSRLEHPVVARISLPGYEYLPETEVPPKSSRPMGLALVYTGVALAGTAALSEGDLGSTSLREAGVIGTGVVLAGFIMTLKKPAPQPARGNILYNRLLREQIARRNAEISQENVRRRQQVEVTVAPLPKTGGGR